jgi:hypothetical protein
MPTTSKVPASGTWRDDSGDLDKEKVSTAGGWNKRNRQVENQPFGRFHAAMSLIYGK